jgi:uncharacterized protein
MLILLPPSEAKNQPVGKSVLDLTKLTFGKELLDIRNRLLNKTLTKSPIAPALSVYSGVLYQALDWDSLSTTSKKRGEKSLLVISALFGVLRPSDKIPHYKYKIKISDWKIALKPVLDGLDTDLIIDCRSSTYAGIWRSDPTKTVLIRVYKKQGGKLSVITHFSKKYRGELVRLILRSNTALKSPQDLLAIAEEKFTCKLRKNSDEKPWYLDLIING